MRLRKVGSGVIVAGAFAIFAVPAMASQRPVVSFSFSDLAGDFALQSEAGSWVFTASDDPETTGDVTRVLGALPGDMTAEFAGNGLNFQGLAAFDLELPIDAATQTEATTTGGSLLLADIDGDSFVLDLNGTWDRIGTFGGWFVGMVNNVQVNTGGDGIFEGTKGNGFSMAGLPQSGLEGTVLALAVPGWFVDGNGDMQGFSGSNVGSVGAIVPEPFTLALLAAGGLVLVSRRKRESA